MTQIPFSVFTAPPGKTLGKTFACHNGKLVRSLQGSVAGGSVRRAYANSLTDFINQAACLNERQALALSLCPYDEAEVVSKQQLLSGTVRGNYVARTRDCFSWFHGWGVLFLDYDPRSGTVPMEAAELVALLRHAVPAFLWATIAHKASSSSFLFAPDGTSVVGLSGQHLFVLVRDARLIPVLAQRIVDQLWFAGQGRYDLSANGSLLERTLFDISVWQPERLIFTRASCLNGILQKLPQTKVFAGAYDELFGEEMPLNEDLLPPLTPNDVQRLSHIKSLAKAGVQPAAKAARQAWIEEQVEEAVKGSSTSADREQLRVSMRAALEGGFLPPELVLTTEHGEQVSVGELLEDPNRWHGKRFADPVEPDYRGAISIAEREDGGFCIGFDDGQSVCACAVVIATGVEYRHLPLARLEDFEGRGVYYATTEVEARYCRDTQAVIVGGGNSAGQAAMYLSRNAAHVHVVVRGPSLAASMSSYLSQRLEADPSITIHYHSEVESLEGVERLERLTIRNRRDGTHLPIDSRALFIMVGAAPNTDWLGDLVELDEKGFIRTGTDCGVRDAPYATSRPGIYAVGDVRAGSIKRVASAVGEGSVVISHVYRHVRPAEG